MSGFSRYHAVSTVLKSRDGRFHFKIKHLDEHTAEIDIDAYPTKDESITVYELGEAIFDYCFGGNSDSFDIKQQTVSFEVRYRLCCHSFELTKRQCAVDVICDLAAQIGL